MIEKSARLLQLRPEFGRDLLRRIIKRVAEAGRPGVIIRRFNIANEPLVIIDVADLVADRNSFAGGHAAKQQPAFEKPCDRARIILIGIGAENPGGPCDVRIVSLLLQPPDVPIGIAPRYVPKRQHIVRQVVMQLDQARQYRPARVNHRRAFEFRGDIGCIRADIRDLTPPDADAAVRMDVGSPVHGDDATRQDDQSRRRGRGTIAQLNEDAQNPLLVLWTAFWRPKQPGV
jgi:hypothetical protein